MPRIRKVRPEEVAEAIDKIIRDYEEHGRAPEYLPTDDKLKKLLKVSVKTMQRWYDGKYDKDKDFLSGDMTYKDAMDNLVMYRSALCAQNIAAGGQVTGWIFLSKQKLWGGFSDVQRTETTGKQEIKVSIMGANGKPLYGK